MNGKNGSYGKHGLAAGALLLAGALGGQAQLTATVQPGYSFSPLERPTTTTLNALGMPTILISGTVSGTVGLSAGSVSGVHLADSVPDGITLNYNTANPRQLQIKLSGVNVNQISPAIAGAGLAGGAGTALYATNVLPSQLLVTNSAVPGGTNLLVLVGTNGYPGVALPLGTGLVLSNGVLVVQGFTNLVSSGAGGSQGKFTSGELAMFMGVTNLAHSLSNTPNLVRWVLICKTNEAGYSPGDEVDAGFPAVGTGSSDQQNYQWGANATNVWLAARNDTPAILGRTNATFSPNLTAVNWRLKCYAVYLP